MYGWHIIPDINTKSSQGEQTEKNHQFLTWKVMFSQIFLT